MFSSVTQSCPTLCNTMDCSTPGFPIHHQLLELTQTHVHQVDVAIQPSHPLPSPSPPPLQSFPASGSFQMSRFFASGGQSVGVSASTSVLPVNIQDWFPLGWTGWISLQSKGLSSETHVSFSFWFPQGTCIGVGLLGHMVVLFLDFKESPYCLPYKWHLLQKSDHIIDNIFLGILNLHDRGEMIMIILQRIIT